MAICAWHKGLAVSKLGVPLRCATGRRAAGFAIRSSPLGTAAQPFAYLTPTLRRCLRCALRLRIAHQGRPGTPSWNVPARGTTAARRTRPPLAARLNPQKPKLRCGLGSVSHGKRQGSEFRVHVALVGVSQAACSQSGYAKKALWRFFFTLPTSPDSPPDCLTATCGQRAAVMRRHRVAYQWKKTGDWLGPVSCRGERRRFLGQSTCYEYDSNTEICYTPLHK